MSVYVCAVLLAHVPGVEVGVGMSRLCAFRQNESARTHDRPQKKTGFLRLFAFRY